MASHAPSTSLPYKFLDDPQSLGVRLAIGLRGSGKSSLLAYQLGEIQKLKTRAAGRIILIDKTRDDYHFSGFGHGTVGRPTEFVSTIGPSAHGQFKIRVVPDVPLKLADDETASKWMLDFFDLICLTAMMLGDCFLLVDEIWNFCTTKSGAQMKPYSFNVLACEGRHQRVRLIATCQRPTQIHNNLRNLVDEFNIFRTKDLKLVAGELETKENIERVPRLPKFHFFTTGSNLPREVVVPNSHEKIESVESPFPFNGKGSRKTLPRG